MLSKTRTTMIALVAAFSFAATTVPVAEARPNDDRYQQSSEAHKRRCGLLKALYDSDVRAAINADPGITKDTEAAGAEYDARAEQDREYAQNLGCAWAR